MEFDEDLVRRTHRFLGRDRVVVATMNPHFNAEWVDSEDAFVDACRERNGRGNIWVMLNPANEGIPATKVESKDISEWTITAFDIDATRATNQKEPATEEEAQEAVVVAMEIVDWLKSKFDISHYLLIMTGNGAAIWIKMTALTITKENWEATQEHSQAFQRLIREKFGNSKVQIDTVGDLKRIMKVPGTMAVKGKEIGGRQHRMATIIEEG